jgi:hypothetical protein
MRTYVPLAWSQVAVLAAQGEVAPPVHACVVDPAWRRGAEDVDEEMWEYEAQSMAAEALGADGGLVVALDLPEGAPFIDDGWISVTAAVRLRDAAALLDVDLSWYGVQELDALLAAR